MVLRALKLGDQNCFIAVVFYKNLSKGEVFINQGHGHWPVSQPKSNLMYIDARDEPKGSLRGAWEEPERSLRGAREEHKNNQGET